VNRLGEGARDVSRPNLRPASSIDPDRFTRKGNSGTKFVRKDDLPASRKQLKNYDAMKKLVDSWVDLVTELSSLRLAQKRT
jgi:hypothetical protein